MARRSSTLGSSTVAEALASATAYWEANENTRSRRGCNMMPIRARMCAELLGLSRKLSSLGPPDGVRLLLALRDRGLARSTVQVTYAAGRRMLALAGVSTLGWPAAPTPPRKQRQPVSEVDVRRLCAWLSGQGYSDTSQLIELMWSTGLRVEVEALNGEWSAEGGRLTVTHGKGGHQRSIPYHGPETGPLREAGGITYEGHLKRIRKGCAELGIDLRPHDLRRAFVKRAYEGSGKDIRVAQVLAGHASLNTTAGYIGVDWDELEAALT